MTDIFTSSPSLLDWEEGNLNDADGNGTGGTGSTVEASTTQAKNGSYGLHCEVTGGNEAKYASVYKAITWPGGDVGYLHFYLYIDSMTAADTWDAADQFIGGFNNDADGLNVGHWNAIMHLSLDPSDGSLWVVYHDGSGSDNTWDTGVDLSADQWYEIEIKCDVSGTNLEMSVWVDGTEYTHTASGTWNDPNKITLCAYNAWAASGGAKDLYFDDVRCEDAQIGSYETGYTLTAEQGTLTLTGQDASLLASRKLTAEQGSYTYSGQATGLLATRLLEAECAVAGEW